MANPQPENGFVKLANEIWNEIIRRDFSKRHKDIILFIWRLSYGCRRKDAYIPKMKDFHLCGIPLTHIKSELLYLESTKVLDWDRDNKLFSINKDYERWQISPGMGWDKERFDELIHQNLTKKSSQNVNFSEEQNFTKDELLENEKFTKHEVESSQNVNIDFTKDELLDASIACCSKVEEVSKDSIKDIIKDSSTSSLNINDEKTATTTVAIGNDFSFSRIYKDYEKNFTIDGKVTPFEVEEIETLFDDYGGEWFHEAMKESSRHNKKTLAYVHGILKGYKSRNGSSKEALISRGEPEIHSTALDLDDPITQLMLRAGELQRAQHGNP